MATGGASNEATTTGWRASTRFEPVRPHPPRTCAGFRSGSWPAFAGLDRRRQSMEALISSLPGSVTHRLAAEVYLRHCDAGAGACAGCGGRVPCPARRHATPVIEAAGEDPRWYDAQALAERPGAAKAPRVAEGHRPEQPAKRRGYAVGGRGRRADVPYTEYER